MADEWLGGTASARPSGITRPPGDFQREADRLIAGRYGPPSVLVNHDFEVQQFRGRTSPYLETPSGQPTTSLLRMAKQGLFMELRSALDRSQDDEQPQSCGKACMSSDGTDDIEFTLRVLPVASRRHQTECCLLVLFETKDLTGVGRGRRRPMRRSGRACRPRRRLAPAGTRVDEAVSPAIVDEQEAASQELRAAHEEVLSSNEELQSTNEELQTAKEELQSANEELTTVNEQSLLRNQALDALTDELSNFISSADLPMVTVARDLRIRRLTPAAQKAFNLLPTDVGRSLEHIKFSLDRRQPRRRSSSR